MQTYELRRFTIIAPTNTNADIPAPYAQNVRNALGARGLNWTEYPTVGSWNGYREPGTLFELYVQRDVQFAYELARLARAAMPDQEAVQVTAEHSTTTVLEA